MPLPVGENPRGHPLLEYATKLATVPGPVRGLFRCGGWVRGGLRGRRFRGGVGVPARSDRWGAAAGPSLGRFSHTPLPQRALTGGDPTPRHRSPGRNPRRTPPPPQTTGAAPGTPSRPLRRRGRRWSPEAPPAGGAPDGGG